MLFKAAVAAAALGFAAAAVPASEAAFRGAGLFTCPELCSISGPNPSNWTQFYSNRDLNYCKNETMLISLPVHMSLDDPRSHSVFRACVSSRSAEVQSRVQQIQKRAVQGIQKSSNFTFIQSTTKTTSSVVAEDLSIALKEIQAKYLDVPAGSGNQTIFFAKRGDSAIGAYVGGDIQKQSIAGTVMEKLAGWIESHVDNLSQTTIFQLCGGGRNADLVLGVVAAGLGSVESVFTAQKFVKTWAEGSCVEDVDGSRESAQMNIGYVKDDAFPTNNETSSSNSTVNFRRHWARAEHPELDRRSDCSVVQVIEGDSCSSLAGKCGISQNAFTVIHKSDPNFCSTLTPGQWVCCSQGTLPDMTPKPNADGSCFSYTVIDNDNCAKIAAAHSLKATDIESLNKNTWGFAGCSSLWPDMLICLSKGDPPMPVALPNAVCGPQVAGTQKPTNGTALADLNPCPLKVCCNVWGQCGTTDDFCIESSLGPPGTSEPGKNGCISSCGMEIVNNDQGPAKFITLQYFEAWNYNRDCLHMDISQLSKSVSNVHFAFADVTSSYTTSIEQVKEQWEKFKSLTGYHKVVAFGGWAASTEPTSYWIFRQGVKPENRETLTTNLVSFIVDNNMDGIDLDWEYPGAQDIPGLPADDPLDGDAYFEFLRLLRRKLPSSKTISIAAPASYWYLKAFPIEKIAKIVDYIVFMTYDLHGQWDYNSKWSMPGCTGVSCLRSHINMTETLNSLAMITKAGVPSNKVVVGVSSYGRSFQMTEAGCTGPNCGFTGPESTAKKGRCTDTSGYISNAEIDEIIRTSGAGGKRAGSLQHFTDDSNSQILIYDDTHWVAYMDDGEKESRKAKWSGLNFAGTTDWAADLATFTPGDNNKQCYLTKHCDSPGADDTSKTSTWRWDQLCTEGAWDAAMDDYKKRKDTDSQGFPRIISNFFNGSPNMDCDVLAGENGCHDFSKCIQGDKTGPAATFILNGFTTISNMLLNMYEGIEDSQQTLEAGSVLDTFVKTFAPEPKGDLALKIILDIVSFALTAATGPFFNNFLRNTVWGKANKDLGDNIKDTTRAVIGFSFTTAKDAIPPKPATGAAMSAQLSVIVRQFKEGLTSTSKSSFSGEDKSIDHLHTMLTAGKLMDAKPTGKLDMEDRMTKLFYAMLIPILWRQKEWNPVLVDTGINCDSKDKFGGQPGDDDGLVCSGGKKYYMVRPDGNIWDCPSASAQHWGMSCKMRSMATMEGFGKLKGGDWADLRREDMVESILARKAAGWNNPTEGGQFPDLGDSGTFDKLWEFVDGDKMIRSPGLVDVPICGPDEIKKNWMNTKKDYYAWPCNKP